MKEYLREYLVRKEWERVDADEIENIYYGAEINIVDPSEESLHAGRLMAVKMFVEKKNWHICDQTGAYCDVRDWYNQESGQVELFRSVKEFLSPIEYVEI